MELRPPRATRTYTLFPYTTLFRSQSTGRFALELEAVSRHFGALVALADINLAVQAGERRAVLGTNGAGKTTLFNAITGDFLPTTERVRLFGQDVADLPTHARVRRGLRRTYHISQRFGCFKVVGKIGRRALWKEGVRTGSTTW